MAQEYAEYLFHQGTNAHSAELLGCHREGDGLVFRTWAPSAAAVHLVGDFNFWDAESMPMSRVTENGIWEIRTPDYPVYSAYKFLVTARDGRRLYKADPYAFHAETAPATASKIYHIEGYEWHDKAWLDYRRRTGVYSTPVNIYELNTVSWRRNPDGSLYSYEMIADELIPYAKKMGYTHVELMPITEYPFDGSWGYQVTGYFAPTSRHGTPHGFMSFVDRLHQAGLGVILDWVPAHFPKDAHGLYEFDGAPCYEYGEPKKMEHKGWGTRVFDYGRNEVRSFLLSSALFWLNNYHVDGLRVDAVASMLYLDYDRRDGEWMPNIYGKNENLEAVSFLQDLAKHVFAEHPDAMLIAEESTSWPNVSRPVEYGGLGFNFKWNMGWMHDVLSYFVTDPIFRGSIHNEITFSFVYAFSENFILPLSHDEVVHCKRSLIEKMPGSYEQKFAGLRALLGFMIAHPGKKMLFMGGEFAQFAEWDNNKQLDWFLLDFPAHREFSDYVSRLNNFYLSRSELWEKDFDREGFDCVVPDDSSQNVLIFERINKSGDRLICVCSFSNVGVDNYSFGVRNEGEYECVFSSADLAGGTYVSTKGSMHGRDNVITVPVRPMSVSFFALKK